MDASEIGKRERRKTEINEELRERSGNVCLEGRLTSFLYELMRDHVPLGVVADLARGAEVEDGPVLYSNGWLARYAEDLAKRLTTP